MITSGETRVRIAGWFRLWVVLSVVGIPMAAYFGDFQQKVKFWGDLDKFSTRICVEQESNLQNHPDALECARKAGTFQTVFQREHTTPAAYWSGVLFGAFLADLAVTAVIIGAAFVVRWVWRGFRPASIAS